MKKLVFLVAAFSLLFLVFGCDSASITADPEGTGNTASILPSDLPATGADSYPQSQTDTLELYSGAMEAFATELNANAMTASYATKGTESETVPLDWSGSVGGGTVDITGLTTMSMTFPDEEDFEPNTTYENFMAATMAMSYQGTIDGVTLSGTTNSYTLSGQVDSDASMTFNVDVETGSDPDMSDTTVDLSYSISVGENHALSILRDDGLGAKMILFYSVRKNWADTFTAEQMEQDPTAMIMDDMLVWLETITVSVKVYNDSDELIGEYNMPLTDLTDLSSIGF